MHQATQNQAAGTSIATNTLFNLAVRIAIIIIVMTAITYYHVTRVITEQSLEQLAKYVAERGESGRMIFKLAKDNHARLKQEILDRYGRAVPPSVESEFTRQLSRFPDGTTRSRLAGFDGRRQAGTFIGRKVKIDTDLKRRVLLFIDLANQYGDAWHHRFQNVYFTSPENLIVEYWPDFPNWTHEAKSDLYMPAEEWVSIASKKHNPERKSAWTGLFYDGVSGLWMASIETPVDYKGRHIATIGHDILLNELMSRTLDDRLKGSYNMIFRQDGRLITHPDKLEAIKHQQGQYDIHQSDDPILKAAYDAVIKGGTQAPVLVNPINKDYLAVSYFPETGWYFVTVYPKLLVEASAFSTARLILLLGIASLLIELLIFYFVLNKHVAQPLLQVMTAVNTMSRGDYQVKLDDSRNDELGRIANAFNNMAQEVQQRTNELLNSEAFKTMLFDSSPIGLALCKMDGSLIDVNPAFANIIGRSIEQTKQLSYWDFTPEDYTDAEHAQLVSLNTKGHYGPYEKEYIHADGHRVPVRLLGQIVERDGEYLIWSSVEDITEKKHAEQVLKQTNLYLEQQVQQRTEEFRHAKEEAEQANRAKSDFLSSMSHELRTPLNAILGFGQLLQFDNRDDQAKDSIDEILNAGNHLLALINEVLDLSRIESGQLDISMDEISLNELLADCIKLLTPSLATLQLTLTDNISSQTNHLIHADYTRFKQVMLNLLSNAVKYNREQGSISLDCEPRSAELLRIRVTDTGTGLTEQQQAQLFIPFERAGAENLSIEGTGIGLVITKRLLELMEGEIGFSSQTGNGSCFWVDIRLCAKRAASANTDHATGFDNIAASRPSTGKTILYVEDNPANLRLVEQLISNKTPHQIISAPDASLGLDIAQGQLPDLILMDINLPGMDGFTALKQLRANKATRHIPVIAISANAMQKDITRGLAAGFHDYVTKPINISKLLDIIKQLLGGHG